MSYKIGKIKLDRTMVALPDEVVTPPIVITNSLDTNLYDDITSNKNWMEIGSNYYDFIFCRDQITVLTATIGFSGMSQEEKEIASSIFAVGKSDRDTVHTEIQQRLNWDEFVLKVQDAREKRWKAAKGYISYYLTPPASWDIAQTTDKLSNDYIIYGIREYSTDGIDGLFDWIGNTSSYSGGTGFSGKAYYTDEYRDNLLNILKNGIY